MIDPINDQEPSLEFPENLDLINKQRESGDFAPADQQDQFPGYPEYPDEEDAFRAGQIVPYMVEGDVVTGDIDPDAWNETVDLTGTDLDVPGSEYDDADELMGKEDEENNYYSLGGDNHDDREAGNLG